LTIVTTNGGSLGDCLQGLFVGSADGFYYFSIDSAVGVQVWQFGLPMRPLYLWTTLVDTKVVDSPMDNPVIETKVC